LVGFLIVRDRSTAVSRCRKWRNTRRRRSA